MADLRRIDDQNAPREDIVDAEFIEIEGEAAPKSQARRDPPSVRSAWQEWWNKQSTLAKSVWIVAPILLLAMCSSGDSSSSDDAASEAIVEVVPTSESSVAASDTPAASANQAAEQLISACYHLDACGQFRILDSQQVATQGNERLVKASLLYGIIPIAPGEDEPHGPVQWEARPKTYYALCSRSRPLIAFRADSKWIAQTFDFVGGIPGVAQNSANIYQVLCHGYFADELATNARSLGYLPNAEGGNQFEIDSPLRLLPQAADKNGDAPNSDASPQDKPVDMEEVMDAAVGRSGKPQAAQAVGGTE